MTVEKTEEHQTTDAEFAAVYAPGGYGVGAIEYVTPEMAGTQIQDAQIYETVARTQAAGLTCWTRITNA